MTLFYKCEECGHWSFAGFAYIFGKIKRKLFPPKRGEIDLSMHELKYSSRGFADHLRRFADEEERRMLFYDGRRP